jgi:hypothetical protein
MVSGHEQSPLANNPDNDSDRRIERLVDQGVATPYGAAAQVLDLDPQRDGTPTVVRDPQAAEAARTRPHHSRRGGRSYPEASDSELDPHWQQAGREQLSDEQRRSNHLAAEIIKNMLHGRPVNPEAAAQHAAHLDAVRARLDAENSTKHQ